MPLLTKSIQGQLTPTMWLCQYPRNLSSLHLLHDTRNKRQLELWMQLKRQPNDKLSTCCLIHICCPLISLTCWALAFRLLWIFLFLFDFLLMRASRARLKLIQKYGNHAQWWGYLCPFHGRIVRDECCMILE